MKLRNKIKSIVLPLATIGLAATPILTATSCANYDSLFFTISSKSLDITFCDRGASIYEMKYHALDGNTYNITYHQQDKTKFVNPANNTYFHGKALGRVTGRFANGKMNFNGKDYTLQINETGGKKNNCLHGGKDAFCFKNFKHYTYQDATQYIVAFNYFSPTGEAGFPEAVDAWVVYTLSKTQDILQTTLLAIPSGPTPINMSTHSLFRLGEEPVKDCELTIKTQTLAKYSDREDQAVVGTVETKYTYAPFDFSTGKLVGKDIAAAAELDKVSNGYDHIWKFEDSQKFYVKLKNPKNKLSLTVATTKNDTCTDGVICYANCYPLKDTKMQDGKQDEQYAGITIEPYTFFTEGNIDLDSNITYTPDKPFFRQFTYTIAQENE